MPPASPAARAFTEPLTGWSFLRAVDVLAPRRVGAVVALGDSLTDGLGSEMNRNARYPDALARRLAAVGPARQRLSVLNAGITGNALLRGFIVPGGGLPAPYRLEDDVSDSGVTDVLLMEGTNDLGLGSDPASVIAGLEELVARLHRGEGGRSSAPFRRARTRRRPPALRAPGDRRAHMS